MKLLLPASLLGAAIVLSGCVVQPSGHDVAYGDPGYGNGGYNDHYDNGGYNNHHRQSGHQTNVYETNVTENHVTENNVTRQNHPNGGSYSQSRSVKSPAARPNPGHPQKASPPHPQQHPQQHPQSTNNQGNGKKKHPNANSNGQN